MVLIVLFLLSTILLFTNIGPLTVIGVFLIICYMPGLLIFVLVKRDKLLFEDFVLSFPFSVGVSCVLTLVLLFLGINVKNILFIIQSIIGGVLIYRLIYRKRNTVFGAVEIKKQELLFLLFAVLMTLLLSIPFFFGTNRIGIAGHAFHHSLMVTQIINGIFPPENPGLGGTSIGYYWGFHSFIAALTVNSNLHQIQIIFILNVLSLFAIICISYSFAKFFNLSEIFRYILPIAVIGLMRADTGIIFMSKLLSAELELFKEITASPIEPFNVLMGWVNGLPWIDTRLYVLRKFYNVSGMPLAITLCYGYLLMLLMMLKKEFSKNRVYQVGIALVISACFLNYPPLAIFLSLHAPFWACYILFSTKGQLKSKITESFKILIPYVISILFVLPYMLYIMASRDISSGGQGGVFSFDFYDQSLKNMVVFLVPLPVILYGAWIVIKRFSFSGESIFLFFGTALSLTLTVFTRWPFDNSYKYNYILMLFFALFFVFALSRLLLLFKSRWLIRLITTLIILFLSFTPIIVESSHIVSSFSTDFVYSFLGKHIIYAQDVQKNEAYKWIQKNTPANALIMLSYIETNLPCCAFNNNYEPAAIGERTLFVIKDSDYTTSNPEYAKRIEFRERLFENPGDPQVADYFTSLNRHVYLLVEDELPEDTYFVEDRFRNFPANPGEHFELVFRNDKQRVYFIQSMKLPGNLFDAL